MLKLILKLKKLILKRFSEMSNKTNQFNSNYQRLSIDKLKFHYKDKNSELISFSVSDKYSDSGIIASLIVNKSKGINLLLNFLFLVERWVEG